MAVILNIDTSSEVCSVCLSDTGRIMAQKDDTSANRHAAILTVFIDELLDKTGVSISDISAVALSNGPGSYTGLRIGASVAKGICYAQDKPLIGVSTLQAMAWQMHLAHPDESGIYIPMIDARRDDVYMAIYDAGNKLLKNDTFATIDAHFFDSLSRYDVKNIYFGGPGSVKLRDRCSNREFGTVIENIICVASNINPISYKKFEAGMTEDLVNYEPFYLKEFEGRMKVK